MLKRICSLLLALTLCLGLWGCGRTPQQPSQPGPEEGTGPAIPDTPEVPDTPDSSEPPSAEPTPEAPAFPVQVTARESSTSACDTDGQTVLLTIKASFPELAGMEQISDYYRDMQADLELLYHSDVEEAAARRKEQLALGDAFIPSQVTMDYQVLRNDGVTLSILRQTVESRGGPAPAATLRAETFDVASQGRLLLSDLLTVPQEEAVGRLMALVWEQMEGQDGALWQVSDPEQLEQLFDPLNFALTDDSLVVFFEGAQLSVQSVGLPRFDLPLESLSDLLRPEYVTE